MHTVHESVLGEALLTQTRMLVDAQINKQEPPTNMSELFPGWHINTFLNVSNSKKQNCKPTFLTSQADTSLLTPRQPVASTFKPSQLCLFTFVSSFSPSNKAVSLCKHSSGREIHLKQIMTDEHNLPLSQFNLFMPSNLFLSSQTLVRAVPTMQHHTSCNSK